MKYLIAAVVIALSTGCASQPSNYVDRSTPEKRDIEATGAAAVEAARSNQSVYGDVKSTNLKVSYSPYEGHDMPKPRYDAQTGQRIRYDRHGNRDRDAERRYNTKSSYSDYASQQFKMQADDRIKRKIRREVNRLVDKLF